VAFLQFTETKLHFQLETWNLKLEVYNRAMFRELWTSAQQLLLPAHCAACSSAAPPDRRVPLCEPCSQALADLIATPACPRCGRTTGPYAFDESGCARCRPHRLRFEAAVRVGPYNDPLRRLIFQCKYQHREEVGHVLARLLAERLALAPWHDLIDVIVPVPLHWSRTLRRGFNQAELVSRDLARTGGSRAARRLRRVRSTPPQAKLNAQERARNVRGAFDLRRDATDLAGKRVLLVDDVMTSGSTVAECALMLRKAKVAAVFVAVVATADYDDVTKW
jgi:ComF family protein